jgi:hypothetical protein
MADEVAVYYVTALPEGSPERCDLGKFFTHEDARLHLKGVHRSWLDAKVEKRHEPRGRQDPAHARVEFETR